MRTSIILITALSLTACSQEGADVHVSNKGHLFYGHDGIRNASHASYAPPQLDKYRPHPYNPDFRVKNGTVNLGSQHVDTTPTKVQTAHVQTKELAPPQRSWQTTQPEPSVLTSSTKSSTFIPPVEGNVVSGYGKRANGSVNDGINYLLPAGEPVYASANGEVAYVGDELKSYGRMAIIKHPNGYNTSYAHLAHSTISKGQQVRQGQIIGYVGQTGNATRPQLHFAIRKGSEPVNPDTVLSKQIAAN